MRLTTGLLALGTLFQNAVAVKEIDDASCFGDTQLPFAEMKYLAFGDKPSGATRVTYWCYGEAGDLDIPDNILWSVTAFNSGNNAGSFEYEPGDGSRYLHSFGKGESNTFDYNRISKIHID